MGDFFHGWRRKIGVVTLLMALLFMAAWIHTINMYAMLSLTTDDLHPFSHITLTLTSLSAWLLLSRSRKTTIK